MPPLSAERALTQQHHGQGMALVGREGLPQGGSKREGWGGGSAMEGAPAHNP